MIEGVVEHALGFESLEGPAEHVVDPGAVGPVAHGHHPPLFGRGVFPVVDVHVPAVDVQGVG